MSKGDTEKLCHPAIGMFGKTGPPLMLGPELKDFEAELTAKASPRRCMPVDRSNASRCTRDAVNERVSTGFVRFHRRLP